MSNVEQLKAARVAAIGCGDKALGREIYHQLLNMGVRPEDIDTRAAAVDALGVERQFAAKPAVRVVEAAVPVPPPAGRVKRSPKS